MDLSPEGAFPVIRFEAADNKEIEHILRFSKGRDVNLSAYALEHLKGLGIAAPIDANERATFSNAYRRLLEQRFNDYRNKGLASSRPYTRLKFQPMLGAVHEPGSLDKQCLADQEI